MPIQAHFCLDCLFSHEHNPPSDCMLGSLIKPSSHASLPLLSLAQLETSPPLLLAPFWGPLVQVLPMLLTIRPFTTTTLHRCLRRTHWPCQLSCCPLPLPSSNPLMLGVHHLPSFGCSPMAMDLILCHRDLPSPLVPPLPLAMDLQIICAMLAWPLFDDALPRTMKLYHEPSSNGRYRLLSASIDQAASPSWIDYPKIYARFDF